MRSSCSIRQAASRPGTKEPRKSKGYRAEEIVGQNFSRFYTPEDIERGKPEESLRIAAVPGALGRRELASPQGWLDILGQRGHYTVAGSRRKAPRLHQGDPRHHRAQARARCISPGDYQRPGFEPEHSSIAVGHLFLPAPDQEVRFRVHRSVRRGNQNAKDRGPRRSARRRISGGRVDSRPPATRPPLGLSIRAGHCCSRASPTKNGPTRCRPSPRNAPCNPAAGCR